MGQVGLATPPLLTQLQGRLVDFYEFDVQVNFTSGVENLEDVGITLGHHIQHWGTQRNLLDGMYGGHWQGNEASIKFALDTETNENLQLYNVSLFGVIPVSTESVPKPQRAGVDVFYKVGGWNRTPNVWEIKAITFLCHRFLNQHSRFLNMHKLELWQLARIQKEFCAKVKLLWWSYTFS